MREAFADFSTAHIEVDVEQLGIDPEGRLVTEHPQLVAALEAAKRAEREKPKPKPPVNTNCGLCNAVAGCGPINNVKGCGDAISR
jgi:hypothetical protein